MVPGSEYEYFDCCNRPDIGSDSTEKICSLVGSLNTALLGSIALTTLIVLCKKKFKAFKQWQFSGQNKILVFTVFFHALTIFWRIILTFYYGRPGNSVEQKWYIIWKSSAVGDLGNTLSAVCVYLRYFT
jgi:hypothetical protein